MDGHGDCRPIDWQTGKLVQFTHLRVFPNVMAAQRWFAGFAWKNFWRRRLRRLLTLGGIGMAIGAFAGMVEALRHD